MFQGIKNLPVAAKRVVAGFILLILVLVGLAIYKTAHPSIGLTNTGLPRASENHSQIISDTYYTFNGLGFFSAPVANPSDVTVLASGDKLPTPSSIVWAGNKGAYMSFNESFILTAAEAYLKNSDKPYEARFNSTWYYDFKTGQLSYVSDTPIQQNKGYYLKQAQKLYYVATPAGAEEGTGEELHIYDALSKVDSIVEFPILASHITAVQPCPGTSSGGVCVITEQDLYIKRSELFKISGSDPLTSLLKTDGTILPSNYPDIYLTFNEKDKVLTDLEDVGPVSYKKGELYNFATKARTSIDRQISVADTLVAVFDGTPEVIDMSANLAYKEDKTIFGTKLSEETVMKDSDKSVLIPADTQGSGLGLQFYDSKGQLWVLSKQGIKAFPSSSPESMKQLVRDCSDKSIRRSTVGAGRIELFFNDDESFNKSVKTVSKCLAHKPASTLQYQFIFSAVSPKNGRVTSD